MSWKYVQRNENGQYKTTESGGGGGGASALTDLDDVSISSQTNGQVLKYNSTSQKWENANESGGGGSVTDVQVDGVSVVNGQGVAEITSPTVPDDLSDLADVQFNSLSDHQLLRYNATSQKWVNGADSYPPLIYSDNEREVGVWRDGKPLYQKTIIVNSVVSGNNTINHEIDNVDEIVNSIGTFFSNADNSSPIPNGNLQSAWSISMFDFGTTNFKLSVGSSWIQYFAYIQVTLQYTKTTDTAGSGSWTTQGTPTHHYSATEQVVGTWIDGKPLYEKTVSFGNLSSGAQTVSMGLSNPDVIVNLDIRAQVPSGAWCCLPMTYLSSNTTVSYGAIADGYSASTDKVTINIGSSRSFTQGYITIQYTKTTN